MTTRRRPSNRNSKQEGSNKTDKILHRLVCILEENGPIQGTKQEVVCELRRHGLLGKDDRGTREERERGSRGDILPQVITVIRDGSGRQLVNFTEEGDWCWLAPVPVTADASSQPIPMPRSFIPALQHA